MKMTSKHLLSGGKMNNFFEENWSCLQCGQCRFFKVDADRSVSTCKRLDHKNIKFAVPWFKSYDCGQYSSIVCREFEPSDTVPWLKDHWKGWDDYWDGEEQNGFIHLILNDDKSVRYAVRRKDFVDNTFKEPDGSLKWIYKEYYKQTRKSPIGYELIKERNPKYETDD